ncbi:peptidoglycan DD-metalloendopeptidase family protein [Algibacter amylolyticus]|uniref:Septal ring factor EnvC, activator of murein hydrolases AmiA and AmiB n=2 Tax=Algibacter TaxID=261827 RepID=A0A1I1NL31_9FLAO|nr:MULTISPECIES: peptidoglycan DD-metalloendopeptidase family protein [Algibacter]KAA5827383.1 peptidoglycan DD-metalloendopeptidase family protein [Algibacter amylolyticus]MBB5266574.1 septal ring factor EnvC (AmiA/AmiB activator) [Algibacter amylolyticus]TSJ81628.1 peptidoglycan DD-metalloendopeptidase family protein [Algibacter amylolyticus]SFC95443.1 Septal ring factor EnvC, activator of murein hydrolases AmiA and AmiB [Algibacter pectinivorans]
MKVSKSTYRLIFILGFLLCSSFSFSQSDKQKQLESRRQELRREIEKINELRNQTKSKTKSELSLIEDFNHKISVLSNLIKVTNQQANLLTREINTNQNKISNLRDELKQLKEDYAAMIVKSYKSKNQQSRIMFLLSSNDFKQAYKRLQYIKQYSDHQKQQGEIIKAKTLELQDINASLLKQQEDKKKLIAENRVVQKSLEAERKQHEVVMAALKKNMSRYVAEIKQKQREADKIDREIDRIIKAAIAKSNKKAGKTTSSKSFALTAEEEVLASNFISNKGKLPWPVEKGFVRLGYGKQPHPIDRSLTINSNGVRIATEKGAKARAVFDGEVSEILKMKNVNPIVMIRHGNYLTLYRNLSQVYVKKGDKVKTKQVIGEVFTNPSNGETILSFTLSKGTATENPASWIYKM